MGTAFEDFGKKKSYSYKLPLLNTWFPKAADQKSLLEALTSATPKPDGTLDIASNPQVQQALFALANYLKGKAQNAPENMLDGFTITTDHLNKANDFVPVFKTLGLKSKLPNGFGVVVDKEKGMFGFVFETTLK
ncbi:MAG: hypothetical protein U1D30_20395 [Planctomycetota bacterium]